MGRRVHPLESALRRRRSAIIERDAAVACRMSPSGSRGSAPPPKMSMGKQLTVLSSVLALLCLAGCIPIGVRGSTMAAADASLRISRAALAVQEAATHALEIANSSAMPESRT
jgi:hypothetical protein